MEVKVYKEWVPSLNEDMKKDGYWGLTLERTRHFVDTIDVDDTKYDRRLDVYTVVIGGTEWSLLGALKKQRKKTSSHDIAKALLELAKALVADDGGVEEVEEIEPQGSKPVKERKKEADDKKVQMAKELLSELGEVDKALKGAIAELKQAAAGKEVRMMKVNNFVNGYLDEGKYYSKATEYFFA